MLSGGRECTNRAVIYLSDERGLREDGVGEKICAESESLGYLYKSVTICNIV